MARVVIVAVALANNPLASAFVPYQPQQAQAYGASSSTPATSNPRMAQHLQLAMTERNGNDSSFGGSVETFGRTLLGFAASAMVAASLTFASPAFAENELSDIYGGKGFDTSLVDQTCLVDRCSLQAKACLADDPSCRKGLTCTAKCLGDNACITGCMARYGNNNLDNLLKCTIEDHECIKIAILPGGADRPGEEPRSPAPTVRNFDYTTMEGQWFKVVGFNPNYDCYACQRNTFSMPQQQQEGLIPLRSDRLNVEVEFSMPHLMPDGSPLPPKNMREQVLVKNDATAYGPKSIGMNEYNTNEVMVFDVKRPAGDAGSNNNLVLNKGKENEASYARTAHSEGEMFGLKFWENWYVIGENDEDQAEFKFIYYNGKTRQNTYEGAFVYSRSQSLEPESMKKVYAIAKEAGMNPDQFCKIRNGCFDKDQSVKELESPIGSPNNPLRGIIASTKVSELLGVEPVSAEDSYYRGTTPQKISSELQPVEKSKNRPWWYEVGDYLENPRRHFEYMDSLRQPMNWPDDARSSL